MVLDQLCVAQQILVPHLSDQLWRGLQVPPEQRTLDKGLEVLKMCINEFNTRFLIGGADFTVKVADKNGIRELDVITAASVSKAA